MPVKKRKLVVKKESNKEKSSKESNKENY